MALNYIDASVAVSLLIPDSLSSRADALLRQLIPDVVFSDLAELEFASALARLVRVGQISASDATAILSDFDTWSARALRVQVQPEDIAVAISVIRGMYTSLRPADAIHVAAARRLGAALLTFDTKMSAGAHSLGVEVIGHPSD